MRILPKSLIAASAYSLATVATAQTELPGPRQTVTVPNAEISYYEAGNPEGDPVVFVHGLPFSSYIWRNVIAEMADGDQRLIAVDLVGFGDSTGTGYETTDQAVHLAEFIDALELDDVTLVGHDWGAGIALMYAGQNPDEVAAFATMEGAMPPVYPRPTYDEMPERIGNMFRSMREPGVAEQNVLGGNLWLDVIMPTMTANPLPDEVIAEYNRPFPTPESRQPILDMSRSLPIGGEPAEAVAVYSAGVDWWTSSAIPKLVIYADPGRLYPEQLALWNQENAQNVTLSNVGPGLHALQEEGPEAVAAALNDWLGTLPHIQASLGNYLIDLDLLNYAPSPIEELVETAAAYGGRSTPGLYATHARAQEGAFIPPHTHPNTLTTVVTSGTVYVGVGEVFDEEALVAYPEGSFFVTEAGVPHFILAKEGSFSVLDHGSGPSGFTLIEQPNQ